MAGQRMYIAVQSLHWVFKAMRTCTTRFNDITHVCASSIRTVRDLKYECGAEV